MGRSYVFGRSPSFFALALWIFATFVIIPSAYAQIMPNPYGLHRQFTTQREVKVVVVPAPQPSPPPAKEISLGVPADHITQWFTLSLGALKSPRLKFRVDLTTIQWAIDLFGKTDLLNKIRKIDRYGGLVALSYSHVLFGRMFGTLYVSRAWSALDIGAKFALGRITVPNSITLEDSFKPSYITTLALLLGFSPVNTAHLRINLSAGPARIMAQTYKTSYTMQPLPRIHFNVHTSIPVTYKDTSFLVRANAVVKLGKHFGLGPFVIGTASQIIPYWAAGLDMSLAF